jgi:hypothetical protein
LCQIAACGAGLEQGAQRSSVWSTGAMSHAVAAESEERRPLRQGDVIALPAKFPVQSPGSRASATHLSESALAVIEWISSTNDMKVRAAAPVEMVREGTESLRFRRFTIDAKHANTIRLAPRRDAMRWRLKGMLFAMMWIVVPAGYTTAGVFGTLAVRSSAGPSAALGCALALFVAAPVSVALGRAACLYRRQDEGACGMGCISIWLVLWLAFCLGPILSVSAAGTLLQIAAQIRDGGFADDVDPTASGSAHGATRLEFMRGTYVDIERAGAVHDEFTRRTFERYFCVAPLRIDAAAADAPVAFWAFEAAIAGKSEIDDEARPYGPCWDRYGGYSGRTSVLYALNMGTERYNRLTATISDLAEDAAAARADAMRRFNLSEVGGGAQVVSVEVALEGDGSLVVALAAEVEWALAWSIAAGPLFLATFLLFFGLLNTCREAEERGCSPRAALAIYGDHQTCAKVMCADDEGF